MGAKKGVSYLSTGSGGEGGTRPLTPHPVKLNVPLSPYTVGTNEISQDSKNH